MWKVLWKHVPECLFGLPKSSFGDHKFGTTIRGWNIWEIREKAVLSKTGMSCRRLYAARCSTVQNLRLVSINLPILWPPNEDLGRPIKHSGTNFQSTFQIREYSIWATFIWKLLWKYVPECLVGLPKSSFGDHKIILCSPNEDFGRLNKALRMRFEVLLKGVSTFFGLPLIEN